MQSVIMKFKDVSAATVVLLYAYLASEQNALSPEAIVECARKYWNSDPEWLASGRPYSAYILSRTDEDKFELADDNSVVHAVRIAGDGRNHQLTLEFPVWLHWEDEEDDTNYSPYVVNRQRYWEPVLEILCRDKE